MCEEGSRSEMPADTSSRPPARGRTPARTTAAGRSEARAAPARGHVHRRRGEALVAVAPGLRLRVRRRGSSLRRLRRAYPAAVAELHVAGTGSFALELVEYA